MPSLRYWMSLLSAQRGTPPDAAQSGGNNGSPGDYRARPAAPGTRTRPAEGRPAYVLVSGVVASGASMLSPGHLLIDSGSSIHLFSDSDLVTDISPADREMKVITAGGPVRCRTVGRCITTGIWG